MLSIDPLDGSLWLIVGLLFILLEVFEGSWVILLPTGVSALIIGVVLSLQDNNLIGVVLSEFLWTLVLWSILSLGISFLIKNFFRTRKSGDDINDY
tara:strand:+ start:1008 stop:1295 length:288 start_codon:yes stop_codon:yes gene_type:complete